MSFEIYFDESHKLDKYTSEYSYYGAIGIQETIRQKFDIFMKESGIYQELHFVKFDLDKIESYLKAFEYILDKIHANFYIVDSNEAFSICDKIGLDKSLLRQLFYIKIPERLIYGITRRIEKFNFVDIYIDNSDEYKNKEDLNKDNNEKVLELKKKLKFQLNAQSLYRGLHYSIDKTKLLDSKDSKAIQIVDVLLGIVVFLFEERYLDPPQLIEKKIFEKIIVNPLLSEEEKSILKSSYNNIKTKDSKEQYKLIITREEDEKFSNLKKIQDKIFLYSQKSIQKSEFIYRLLMNKDNLKKFYKFTLFFWTTDEEYCEDDISVEIVKNKLSKEVKKDHISKYVTQFFQFKNHYDNVNRLKILEFSNNNKKLMEEKQYKDYLGWGSSLKLLVRRYLKELNIKTK